MTLINSFTITHINKWLNAPIWDLLTKRISSVFAHLIWIIIERIKIGHLAIFELAFYIFKLKFEAPYFLLIITIKILQKIFFREVFISNHPIFAWKREVFNLPLRAFDCHIVSTFSFYSRSCFNCHLFPISKM